jgi:hypothetical protein
MLLPQGPDSTATSESPRREKLCESDCIVDADRLLTPEHNNGKCDPLNNAKENDPAHAVSHKTVPAAFFGMPLGIVALRLAWRTATVIWAMPKWISDSLMSSSLFSGQIFQHFVTRLA